MCLILGKFLAKEGKCGHILLGKGQRVTDEQVREVSAVLCSRAQEISSLM